MKQLLLVLISFSAIAQDTTIKNNAYTSIYSKELKAPICVYYTLFKGGGECSRKGDTFHAGFFTATNKDYDFHYDKGHLANAEDFAYNCELQEITFRFWNCFPQTPELNRGIWKVQETQLRKLSQTDSLIIYCGGFYGVKKIGNNVSVPDSCWKVAYNIKNKQFLECSIFTNVANSTKSNISLDSLNALLIERYNINILKLK